MPDLDPTDPIDELVRQLGVREAPRAPPQLDWVPRRRRLWPAILAIAAAALLTVGAQQWARAPEPAEPGEPTEGARGLLRSHNSAVALYLSARRDERVWRLADQEQLRVGDEVYFRLSASRPAEVRLWVDGPEGRSEIAKINVDTQLRDARIGDDLYGWSFDRPGFYSFCAAPTDGLSPQDCTLVQVASPSGEVPTEIAAFSLRTRDIDGRRVELEAPLEGPLVLAFWSANCERCGADLAALGARVQAHPAVRLVLVATDSGADTVRIRGLLKVNQLPYTVLQDSDGSIRGALGVTNIPSVLLLDEGAHVMKRFEDISPSELAALDDAMDGMVPPTAPAP